MALADEIKTLKELLDSGALTPSEFDEAKRGLLQGLSRGSEGMPAKSYFVGKWRIGNDLPAADITLAADGTFNIKVDLSKEASKAQVYWTMVKLMKLNAVNGEWWLDGKTLRMQGKGGDPACRYLLQKYTSAPPAELDFNNLVRLPFALTLQVMSHKHDEFRGISDAINVDLFRLSTN